MLRGAALLGPRRLADFERSDYWGVVRLRDLSVDAECDRLVMEYPVMDLRPAVVGEQITGNEHVVEHLTSTQ